MGARNVGFSETYRVNSDVFPFGLQICPLLVNNGSLLHFLISLLISMLLTMELQKKIIFICEFDTVSFGTTQFYHLWAQVFSKTLLLFILHNSSLLFWDCNACGHVLSAKWQQKDNNNRFTVHLGEYTMWTEKIFEYSEWANANHRQTVTHHYLIFKKISFRFSKLHVKLANKLGFINLLHAIWLECVSTAWTKIEKKIEMPREKNL